MMFSSKVKILELIGSVNLQYLGSKIVFADRRTTLGTYYAKTKADAFKVFKFIHKVRGIALHMRGPYHFLLEGRSMVFVKN